MANTIFTVGANHVLDVAFNGAAQNTSWYIGLAGANVNPSASDSFATFLAAASEVTAYTTVASARLLTDPAAAASKAVALTSSVVFSFTGSATVYGIFITTSATQGSSTGVLLAYIPLSSSKSFVSGETFTVSGNLLSF